MMTVTPDTSTERAAPVLAILPSIGLDGDIDRHCD